MDISVLLWVVVAAIAACVVLNVLFKINIGLSGFAFAFVIGVFLMGESVRNVAAQFPANIYIQMILVPAFFSFAVKNGTLSLLADKVLYAFRGKPVLIPFVFLVIGLLMGVFGAGPTVNNVVLAVMVFNVGLAMGLSPWLCIIIICFGANLGTFAPWAMYGNTVSKTAEGWLPGQGNEVAWKMVAAWAIITMIMFLIFWVLTKGFRVKAVSMDKPGSFNKDQKTTLILMIVFVAMLLIPAILNMALPGIPIFKTMTTWFDATVLAAIFIIISLLLKLGTQKELLSEGIPWSAALMVAGICTLLNLATSHGVTDYIGEFLSSNVGPGLMPILLCLIAAFLSCFAGAIMTVYPMLGAIAIPYAQAAGIDPIPLLLAIMVGASVTAISPLSSGGALMLSMCPSDELRDSLFNKCLAMAGIGTVIAVILSATVFRLL